jgi:hypothetical protein
MIRAVRPCYVLSQKRISEAVRLEIVTRTAKERPANVTHWIARMLAAELVVGHTTVDLIEKPRCRRSGFRAC